MPKKRKKRVPFKYPEHLKNHPVYGSPEWKLLKRFVNKFFGKKCLRCQRTTGMFHADHVVPYASNELRKFDPTNLQQLCAPCNVWKGGRYMEFRTKYPSPEDLVLYRVNHLVPGYKAPGDPSKDAKAAHIRIREGIRTRVQ